MVDSVTGLRYAEFPVPPITLLTDMVSRCRLLAAHGPRSCSSVRTQPLTATGAPSQTSTMPCHAMTPLRSVLDVFGLPSVLVGLRWGFFFVWDSWLIGLRLVFGA